MQTTKLIAAALASLSLLASVGGRGVRTLPAMESAAPEPAAVQDTQHVAVTRNGARPSQRGPAETFTGTVRVDPLFDPNDASRAGAAFVTFEPGARTAWHTHPRGQRLVVTAGVGRVQGWGGPMNEIRPGDVVWIPAGVKHWHGASPTVAMTHIAIQEALDGTVVTWLEQVSDPQYGTATR